MSARLRAFLCVSLLTAAAAVHWATAGPEAGSRTLASVPGTGTTVVDWPCGDNGWW
ncbi:hypothetical protein [Streptomyces sp. BE230]|uniref:hypothetical protein n=1 Tax=Streptomyces sp. BE230 TaxID=3002526 RepID=UPI002ED628F1|nr:hypothetical protein [Streptomyces sp. BE230]